MATVAIRPDLIPADALPRLDALAGAWHASLPSANTRHSYRTGLADFARFCAEHDLDPLAATRQVVDLFARALDDLGRSPSTVARRLSGLGSFFAYLAEEEVLTASPVERVRRPQVAKESPTLGLDRAEARSLLDAAQAARPRDHALVCLLTLNGLRVSEALALTIADLDTERGHRVVRIVGKGAKRRTALLAPRTIDATEATVGDRSEGPIIEANYGGPMNRHQATRAVRRLTRTPASPRPFRLTRVDTHDGDSGARSRRTNPRRAGGHRARQPRHHAPLRPGTARPRPPRHLRPGPAPRLTGAATMPPTTDHRVAGTGHRARQVPPTPTPPTGRSRRPIGPTTARTR
jgi:integrase/recombinase XerD